MSHPTNEHRITDHPQDHGISPLKAFLLQEEDLTTVYGKSESKATTSMHEDVYV